ncbi:hypothetical protein JYT44_01835 [Caldithrix abyssi]|nr:hypothetical protein [Caldithrix abyssi]
MKKMNKKTCLVLVTVLGFWSCAELDVSNTNDPDKNRALAKPSDVESFIKGSFLTWWQGTHTTGGSFNPGVMADAHTCSWGNYGMRELSSEPRAEANNSPAYNYAYALEQPWYRWYGAISAANDGSISLKALQSQSADGTAMGSEDSDNRALIFAKFISGISHGMVAIYYDQGFFVDEDTDFDVGLDLLGYNDLMMKAVGVLEGVVNDANSNASITLPESWLQIPNLTLADLAGIANSFIARFKAGVSRTAAERRAVDWVSVKSRAELGKPFAPVGDGDFWWSRTQYYTGVSRSWGRADYWMIGPADKSDGFKDWVGDNSAETIQGRMAFSMETDDARITGALDDSTGEQTQGLYCANEYRTRYIASRGTYHQTYYVLNKTRTYAVDQGLEGPMHDVTQAELDLLVAEANLRAGDAAAAAAAINMTRVTNGSLTPAAAADGVGADTDAPNALDAGTLWAKYKYEKIFEGVFTHPYLPYTDRRGWDNLLKGTPLHLALPGKELEILLLDNYTFGGQDRVGNPGTAGKLLRGGFQIQWDKLEPLIQADME